MALKWKKDGTAKCGPFTIERNSFTGVCSVWADDFGEEVAEFSTLYSAESWLRKQAAKMLKDLGGK